MGLSDNYSKEIRSQFSYFATWFPDVHLSVGDVVRFEDRQVHLVGTLKEYGIPFSVRTSPPGRKFDYNSKGAILFTLKAAGQTPLPGVNIGKAEAGVSVKFNTESAILFNTTDTKLDMIENMDSVSKKIMEKRKNNDWDRKYALISQCVVAGGTTIIISQGKNSQIDFTATGNLTMANLNLADLNLKLNATKKFNIGFEYIAKENFTPLFEAWGFKRTWSNPSGNELTPLQMLAPRMGKTPNQNGKVEIEEFTKLDDHNDLEDN